MDLGTPAQGTNGDRTVYEFQPTEAECIAALQFNQSRLRRSLPRSYVGIGLSALGFAAFFTVTFLTLWLLSLERSGLVLWLAVSIFAAIALMLSSQLLLRHRLFRAIAAIDGTQREKRTITLEEGGLRSRSARGEAWVQWNGIRSIEEWHGQVLLYVDDVSFIGIPGSAFTDTAKRGEFVAELRRRVFKAKKSKQLELDQATAGSAPASSVLKGEQRNPPSLHKHIREGFRLAFFLRPKMDIGASEQAWSTLVSLLFLSIALSFLGDRLEVGPNGSFSSIGLPGVVFGVPVMMVGAWAVARFVGRGRETLGLLTVLTSLAIPIAIVEIAIRLWVAKRGGELVYLQHFIFPIWFTPAATVAVIRLLGTPPRRWLAIFLMAGLLMGLPMATVYRSRTLWWGSDEGAEDVAKYAALNSEEVFYLQPRLLEQQLAAMKPGRPGVIDLYFIGLAPYANQEVFMREVLSVATLFDQRFDTAGRSLMLINNAATVRVLPIASATSLGIALKRLSEIMNQDEDILFLFITSHGSSEDGVAFEFSPLHFKQLNPKELKDLLDQYGIRRRVVVVSACYSGKFVDALKDDDTLVISASANDRNSFGCSNDAEFTYFGKAYFEALQHTYSFSEAFDRAKPVIADRERQAHYPDSSPKIFVGEKIKLALDDFVRARESSAKATSAALLE